MVYLWLGGVLLDVFLNDKGEMHRGGYTVIPFLNSKHWTKPQNIRACECVCVCTHVCCVNVNLEKNMEGNTQIANRDDWQCGEEEGFLGLKRKNGQNICYDYTAIKESDEKLATTWIRIHHDRQECPSSTWSQSSGIFSFIELKKNISLYNVSGKESVY